MGFGFTDLTPEGKKYFRELKKMTDMEIQVGFQGDQKYEDGTSIAQVAAINEFGASDIPERPFMRQSFENHEGELQAACDAAQRLVSSGGSAEQALQQIAVQHNRSGVQIHRSLPVDRAQGPQLLFALLVEEVRHIALSVAQEDAVILSGLSHPSIPEFLGVANSRRGYFFVLEYMFAVLIY